MIISIDINIYILFVIVEYSHRAVEQWLSSETTTVDKASTGFDYIITLFTLIKLLLLQLQ